MKTQFSKSVYASMSNHLQKNRRREFDAKRIQSAACNHPHMRCQREPGWRTMAYLAHFR